MCICETQWKSYLWWAWRGIFICEHPYNHLHGSTDFDSRARFDLNTSHVFPQGVLSAIILLGGGVRDEGPEPGVIQGFPSAQWPSQSYLGYGESQVARAEALRVGLSWLHSLIVCVLLSPSTGPLSPRGELKCLFGNSQCSGCGGQAALRGLVCLWCAACVSGSNGCRFLQPWN